MDTHNGRDGPVPKEVEPQLPARATAAPDPKESVPQLVILNGTDHGAELQTGQHPGVKPSSLSHLASTPSRSSSDVRYDSGWIVLEDGRRVRLCLIGKRDVGERAGWVRRNILTGLDSSEDSDDDGEPDDTDNSGRQAGGGIPKPPLGPAGSDAVSVPV